MRRKFVLKVQESAEYVDVEGFLERYAEVLIQELEREKVTQAVVLAFALVFGTVMPVVGQRPAEQTVLEVQLPGVSKADAYNRVVAAFAKDGIVVGEGSSQDAGVIVSVPWIYNPGSISRGEVVYRAMIIAGDSGSRVLLSGTSRAVDAGTWSEAASGIRVESPADPLTSKMRSNKPKHQWAWDRIERLATYIQSP